METGKTPMQYNKNCGSIKRGVSYELTSCRRPTTVDTGT